MSERIAGHDWASTPLGPVDGWPQSLQTAVRIVLGSRFSRFAARFSFIDIFATFLLPRSCGDLPDIVSSLPLVGWR